jgi:type IV fimbrial biogenesis protein FimT
LKLGQLPEKGVETRVNSKQTRREIATRKGPAARVAGYTLLELLVALAIIAILGTMMGPNMLSVVDRNRKAAALSDTFGMLSMARSEAVNQQATVALCPTTDQATCNGSDWEDGWLLFVDDGSGTGGTANDGNINGTEALLRVGQPASGVITIRSRNFSDAGAISFDLDGMAEERGTIVICDDNGHTEASAVVLNFSGQPRLAGDDDNNGTLDEDDGSEISACP